MRSRLASLFAVVTAATVLFGAAPAGAITYGTPDDGEHPYVGFIIYWVPSEKSWFSCSGTLLDERTFLTAGHCVYGVGTDGRSAGTSGGNDVWVTFAEEDVLEGFPPRDAFPTARELYEARSAWLNANPDYIRGTAIPDPRYDDFSGFPVTYDLGVVELGSDAPVTTYGVLAPLGTVEDLAGDTGRGRNDALVENVGYGIQSVQPHPMDEASRYQSTSRIVETNGNIADGGNLHTLNNPSAVGGRGGTCFGDSGGPVFVNNTNQVVAVVSFGFSGTCHGADYSWRVDTQPSYDFLLRFIA